MALPETTLVLYAPSVAGDSVSGFLERDPPAERVAVPAFEIRKLEVRGMSNTGPAVITGVWVWLAVAIAVISTNHHATMH